MDKRLLYITSSRDADTFLTSEEYRTKNPFGHGQILFHLERLGWNIKRLAIYESWNPWILSRYIQKYQPSLIFTNGSTALSPVLARRWACSWRGPIILGWDDFYKVIWDTNFGWLAGQFMRWFEPCIVRGSDYIVTISYYNQKRADALGKRTWFIPNGCDEPVYDSRRCPTCLSGVMNLVYCGDQGRYKRTGDIVRAMAHVPKDIRLYLIGYPNPKLQKYASENVIFLGRLSENDKWAVMSQADVLVCTADTDCNAKFHEYLRMGKPILGYDGIANHLFQNRRNALLTRDYPTAIQELYRSPELRAILASNAAKDIPVYTWREIAERYDRAFTGICELYSNELKKRDVK